MVARAESVSVRYCDACGARVHDGAPDLFCTVHGPAGWRSDGSSDVVYEWSPHGDYCERCKKALAEAYTARMPLPDRYNRSVDVARIDVEVIMIREALYGRDA